MNSITIGWPAGFFTLTSQAASGCTAAPVLSAEGALITAGYKVDTFGDGGFVLKGTAPLTAGVITVTFSGVTLKSTAVAGTDDGITVVTKMGATTVDAAGTGATGAISGYQVTAVSLPTCQISTTTCQPFVITFMSRAKVTSGGTIVITFTDKAGTGTEMPLSGKPNAFMYQGVLFTGDISTNVLTLTAASNTGEFEFDGTSVTLTLTGMQIKAATPSSRGPVYVFMGSGFAASYSAMLAPTGTTTKTTSLVIDRPFPGVTGAQATVSFTTTTALTAAGSDVIYMSLPVGFFAAFSTVRTCTNAAFTSGKYSASSALTCVTLAATNVRTVTPDMGSKYDLVEVSVTAGSLPAGSNSFVLTGVNLNVAAVAASTAFSVTTSQDVCSLGAVSTGSISNSNPGGTASSAASAVLSIVLSLSIYLVILL